MEKGKQKYKLPDGWIEIEIKDISLKINYGYTAKSILNNTGTKFLRITDIQDNHVDWSAVPYCEIDKPKIHFKEWRYSICTNRGYSWKKLFNWG